MSLSAAPPQPIVRTMDCTGCNAPTRVQDATGFASEPPRPLCPRCRLQEMVHRNTSRVEAPAELTGPTPSERIAEAADALGLTYPGELGRAMRSHLLALDFPDRAAGLFRIGSVFATHAAAGPLYPQMLRDHAHGRWGLIGDHDPAAATPEAREMGPLADRAARNALTLDDGIGDIVSAWKKGDLCVVVVTALSPGRFWEDGKEARTLVALRSEISAPGLL